ncbi:MAG TPA: polysaccharide deacetylase family protein [Candidatus Dormibacteraeota bacterium]|nr:polysaccharide deacetylase family protein [Candidatus Dormibacteraeota bacterium]
MTPRPSPTPVAYLVRTGDTLTSIARAFDTTARSIAFWNRDTYPSLDPQSAGYAPDRIAVGWTLRIWPGQVVDEAIIPPASPHPTPSAALVLPPGPTPAADGTSVLVSNGPRGGNGIALTFDMGGRLDPALDIVDWLIANDVPATIFPTGRTASTTDIGQAVMARLAAHRDQFAVGNHTWDHPDMTKLGATAIASELNDTESVIVSLVGRSSKPLYRPPFGSQDLATRKVIGGLGWSYTIMWDVDTIDWKPIADGGPTADDIVAKVLSRARGGSIVLMHLGGYETYAALPRVVAGLRAMGLQPVTLTQMLGS